MKRISIFTIIFLATLPLFAQTLFPELAPERPLDPLLENKDYSYYVGTWKWEDTTTQSEFVIKLVLAQTTDPDWTVDYLKGAYMYKKNGAIVADYMNELSEEKDFVQYPIYIFCDKNNNMELGIRDYLLKNGYNEAKHHGGSSYIKYISSTPEQIKWKIVDDGLSGALFADEKLLPPPGISLPEEIILTKIE